MDTDGRAAETQNSRSFANAPECWRTGQKELKIRFGVSQVRVRAPPAPPRNPHKSRSESLQLSGVSAAESPTIIALYPNLYPNLQLLPTKDALHRSSRLLLRIRQHVTVQIQGNGNGNGAVPEYLRDDLDIDPL